MSPKALKKKKKKNFNPNKIDWTVSKSRCSMLFDALGGRIILIIVFQLFVDLHEFSNWRAGFLQQTVPKAENLKQENKTFVGKT